MWLVISKSYWIWRTRGHYTGSSASRQRHCDSEGTVLFAGKTVWSMSERIWGDLRKNALYKSTYTLQTTN